MNVPYTTSTGIQIGIRYMEQGKRAPIDDPDMQYLQMALLANPTYLSSKRKYEWTIALSATVFIATVVAIFLLN